MIWTAVNRPDLDPLFAPDATLLVAGVTDDGEPRAGRAWVVLPGDSASQVRVVASADDPGMVAAMRSGAALAVTSGDVRTLRSCQVKGTIVAVEPTTDVELAAMEVAVEGFVQAVHETDGSPPHELRRLLPHAVVTVVVDVAEVFDQSPGPGAGSRST
ncbi:MAG: hypothetical protein MUE78_13570 [Ilumatobacteraceae bacterium]|jgi:hypothetical protein|nr:hypothetical protein [Ilumatobacteraceae bacterium]